MRRIYIVVSVLVVIVVAVWFVNAYQAQRELEQRFNLPPDPGSVGKATLEGIDVDNDGVRDDVQRYIAFTYPDSAKKRAAVTQEAKAYFLSFDPTLTRETAGEVFVKKEQAASCSWYVFDDLSASQEAGDQLFERIMNTNERAKAHQEYNEKLGGQAFYGTSWDERKTVCDFDPDSLQN